MLMIKKDFAVIDEILANKVSDAFIIDENWGETKHNTPKSELKSKFLLLNHWSLVSLPIGQQILDPFSGTSTILSEQAKIYHVTAPVYQNRWKFIR